MRALIGLVPLVLVSTMLTSAVQSAEATQTGALPGFCQLAPDGTANTWTGNGLTDNWEDPTNWSDPNGYPGFPGADPDACVPTGGTPVIEGGLLGQEEHVRTLDIASGATVTIAPGGKLFLYGSQSAGQDSVVRWGGRLDLTGGTLGGVAHLHVIGTLEVENDGSGAPVLLTRDCAYDTDGSDGPEYPGEEPCSSPDPTPVSGSTFLVEVDDRGVVDVRGGGVNLGDQARIVNRGFVAVRAGAYIAADHGTRLELRPHRTALAGAGTLRLEGNGGYLEGKIASDTGVAALSALVNQGRIIKSGGAGRALVSAAYSQPSPGDVRVHKGTLLLPTGPVTPAFVAAGAAYGTGRCSPSQNNDPACTPTTQNRAGYRQAADLRVPTVDTNGARVKVRELGAKSTSDDLGNPFDVHATSLRATRANPAVIRLRIDASVAKGLGYGRTKVYRKSGTAPYRLVRACTSTGRPPTGQVACVDRRGLAVSSRNIPNASGAPDVLMVIRTTATSRWVGRRR